MTKDRSHSGDLPKPGPRVIRAWFDTVINPLLAALDIEKQYLERKDWSWNHWRGKLESIMPVAELVGRSVEPNLHQFYEFHPDIQKHADEHDAAVRELWMQCMTLQTALQASEELRQLYTKASSGEMLDELRRHGQKVDDDMSEEEDLPVYAEYVINSRSMLPSYYTTSGLWNTWRDQFLELQQTPLIKPYYEMALGVGEELLKWVQTLAALLAERRNELSIEYDVPIVSLNQAA